MEKPLALRLIDSEIPDVYRVSIDPLFAKHFRVEGSGSVPAVLVSRKAAILQEMSAGMIDVADIVAFREGDWGDAILVVLPTVASSDTKHQQSAPAGDSKFLSEVERNSPELSDLATQTIQAIRAAGVDGELVEGSGGRWINRPINTFTLKAQPRKGDLAFTLYGNPETYDAPGFLRKDQNSYSRGWVHGPKDVTMLAELARRSHDRRRRN